MTRPEEIGRREPDGASGSPGAVSGGPRCSPERRRVLPTANAIPTTRWDDSASVRVSTDPGPTALAEWDRLVQATPGTDVTQLSRWATLRARLGFRPTYVFAYHSGALVGGALVLRRRLFGALSIGYLPYGPVIGPSAPDRAGARTALVEALLPIAHQLRVMFIQPPEHGDDISEALLAAGFRPSTAGIAPAGSYRLELTADLDRIRARFSKRLRSWPNRWADKGVTVRRGDERDLPIMHELMSRTGERQGFAPPTLDYLQALYRELAWGGNAALFIGQVHGVPVCADVVTMCGPMVRGRFGGFDHSGPAGKLSVPAAVRWEIIKWAKARGYRWLDFGGLPEQMLSDMLDLGINTSDQWPSAHRSKLSFHGTPFRYPQAVELLRPGITRTSYDLLTRHPHGRRLVQRAKTLLQRGHHATRTGRT